MSEVSIGIDVAKEGLDVAVRPTGEAWSEQNNKAGIKALTLKTKKLSSEGCVGSYWRL